MYTKGFLAKDSSSERTDLFFLLLLHDRPLHWIPAQRCDDQRPRSAVGSRTRPGWATHSHEDVKNFWLCCSFWKLYIILPVIKLRFSYLSLPLLSTSFRNIQQETIRKYFGKVFAIEKLAEKVEITVTFLRFSGAISERKCSILIPPH